MLESPFTVEIVSNCTLNHLDSDKKVELNAGDLCMVHVSSGRTNYNFESTRFSFNDLETSGFDGYLGFLEEDDFRDAISKCKIRRK